MLTKIANLSLPKLKNAKNLLVQWRGALTVAPCVAFLTIAGNYLGLWQILEWAVHDAFFSYRSLESIEESIVIVTIDEEDITAVGDWPITDQILADLLIKIQAQSPRVVGMDLYRNLPEPPGHEQLVQQFRSMPNLIGVEEIFNDRVAPSPVLDELGQIALADLVLDGDRKLRRALLSAYDPQSQQDFKSGLATRVASMYLETEGITIETIDSQQGKFRLGKTVFTPLLPTEAGYTYEEVAGYQILLNWRGAKDRFPTISLTDVLNDNIPPNLLRDRAVLIGSIGTSTNDFFETPYSSTWFSNKESTPGVVVHANIASQIIRSAWEGRRLIRGLTRFWTWNWILLWSLIGAITTWKLETSSQGQKQFLGSTTLWGMVVVTSLFIGGSYSCFLAGLLLPIIAPLVALISSSIVSLNVYQKQQLLDYSRTLEVKVKERTQELEIAKLAADSANEAKSEFLASMSHELRTPLNGILGYAQIMARDEDVTPKLQKGIQVVYQSGSHLLNLINDILDLSKIEARKLELYNQDFHFPNLLTGVTEICRIKAQQKNVEFLYQASNNLPQAVHSDDKRLRQVLINLLGNAIKFTDSGSVTLAVEILATSANQSQIRFQITDTGVGMTPEQVEKIFLPFEQVGDHNRRAQGTGLGLAITQKIVQLMGSEISVTSTLGKGSTFSFELSLLGAKTTVSTNKVDHSKQIQGYQGKPRQILVVDDLESNRAIIINLLVPLGFQVWEAENGQEGLEQVTKLQPDLVITDLAMPELDGLEMTRRLRHMPEFQNLAIIASSANVYESVQKSSVQAGCQAFLPKPIQASELCNQLQQLLDLTWVYQTQNSASSAETDEANQGVMVIPTIEKLQILSDLAKKGFADKLIEEIEQLELEDYQYHCFAQEIKILAQGYQMRKIRTLLKEYLETS